MLKLFPYQEEIKATLLKKKRFAIFTDPGTGKTPPAIELIKELSDQDFPILIVAPAYILGHWRNEFTKWGGSKQVVPLMEAKQLFRLRNLPVGRWIYLISYSSLRSRKNSPMVRALDNTVRTVILDESLRIANGLSQTSQLFNGRKALFRRSVRRYLLCGAPMTESELQIFSQYRFLSPIYFGSSFIAFRDKFFEVDWFGTTWKLKSARKAEFMRILNSACIRKTREELLPQLPGSMKIQVIGELKPEEKAVIKTLQEDWGLVLGDTSYYTQTVLARARKEQQITAGYILLKEQEAFLSETVLTKKHDKEYLHDRNLAAHVSYKTPGRLAVLDNLLTDLGGIKSTIIFCSQRVEVELLARYFFQYHPSVNLACVTGDVPVSERDKIRQEFQNGNIQVIIATISSIAEGVSLTAASRMIFYTHTHSWNTRYQAEARPQRHGQEQKLLIYDIVMKDTIDEKIMKAYERKQSLEQYFGKEKKHGSA